MNTNEEFKVIVNALIVSHDIPWLDRALEFIEHARPKGADAITMTCTSQGIETGWVNLKLRPENPGFRLELPTDWEVIK